MHWTHLFLISSYDFISCSTKASSLSFSVSISCSAMSSDIFSVSRWLKQGSFSWIWKCFNLSTFRRLRNSSKIISSLLIFAGIRTVQNDHLWLISPNWIKAGSLQRTLVLQLICECHSPAQRFVLVPIFVKISLWWCRFFLSRLNWRKRQREREISNYPPFPHLQNDFPVHWNWRSDSFCIRPRFQKGTNFLSRGIIWCIRVRNAFNINWYAYHIIYAYHILYDRFHLMNLLVQICWYLNDSPSLLQNFCSHWISVF